MKRQLSEHKNEGIELLHHSKVVRLAKYTVVVLLSVYLLGHIFKILAFTTKSFNSFKTAIRNE